MQPNTYAVYSPSENELPYLSVVITSRGTVEAHSFETYGEAFHHGRHLKSVLEPHAEAADTLAKSIMQMHTSPLAA